MGLRELKKEQTRQLIADTAWRLFADRGFDKVTVAEIAREAQVAEATVFNYFPSKEDLFYSRFEAFSARLADAVRDREPGAAGPRRLPPGPAGGGRPARPGRSRRQAGARPGSARSTGCERAARPCSPASSRRYPAAPMTSPRCWPPRPVRRPNDIRPQVAANALLGLQRAMIDYVRGRVSSGESLSGLAADVRKLTAEAFALLEHGLAGYATKP